VSIFVWTKIGTEAGEGVDKILARKENERIEGAGIFWWGIGTSLGPALCEQARLTGGKIPVLFCEMLGKAQSHDASPTSTIRWLRWRDWASSEFDVPSFVEVTSRGEDRNGKRKDKHYALVCCSETKIDIDRTGRLFDPKNCRTLRGKVPGDSQNTALLEGDFSQSHPNGRYRIAFTANLVSPWQAHLTR
jgi:hypothetical protein